MANSAQARKRAIQNRKKNILRSSQNSMVRTYIKKVVNSIKKKDKQGASESYAKMVPVIDRMVNKGIIHKNKAARHKSRLNAHVKSLA